ncbi:hypothetical protein GJ744_006255 [Endocarpon pusillum]|uniref:Uncharacterized protein n=1 Tax=Endocarpon pusillum TaxID=364733 RepID=A0A8H7E729_9EURO|nr:hypothetical protein GJ744_006255 [Endocarpon pusillum]
MGYILILTTATQPNGPRIKKPNQKSLAHTRHSKPDLFKRAEQTCHKHDALLSAMELEATTGLYSMHGMESGDCPPVSHFLRDMANGVHERGEPDLEPLPSLRKHNPDRARIRPYSTAEVFEVARRQMQIAQDARIVL